MSKVRFSYAVMLTVIFVGCLSLTASPENSAAGWHWVSAWSASVHTPLPFPGLPPAPVFENQTVRLVVRPTIGGDRVRIRLSNAFGTAALAIGAAHIALTKDKSGIVPESDHALTFGGRPSVSIPPGAPILSDPVDLKVSAFTEISVSLYLPEKTPSSTYHFWGQHETYVSEAGDFTAKEMSNPATKSSWYWLADVEVWAPDQAAATVAFGDSITDGVGAKQGDYTDWPDMLAKRLADEKNAPPLAVVNEGIGGNRVLFDGAGVSALARLDRDVLAQPGVKNMIVLESINDIGWPHMKPPRPPNSGEAPREMPFVHQMVTAQDLIMGMQQLIDRAHQHGIRVFGATLTPYEGANYYTDDGEATRQEVNGWIRTGGKFDGFFDFDAAVRDPSHPGMFLAAYDSGDHLHPSAAGFKAMAGAVDLAALRGKKGAPAKK
jgi:lysophospholipase L1-like esterase